MKYILPVLGFVGSCVFSAAFGGQAFAAESSRSADLNLKLKVREGCSIRLDNGSSVISFGTFIALKNPVMRTGSFSLSCTAGYNSKEKIPVSLDAGSADAGDKVSDRKLYLNGLAQSGQALHFQVFMEDSGSTVWGNGTGGSSFYRISYSDKEPDKRYPFRVVLLAQQLDNLSAGTYSNVLTMAVNWPGEGS